MKTVRDFMFLGSKITADGDCSHEIKRHLLFGRNAMTNLDSILKSKDHFANKGSSSQSYGFSSSLYGYAAAAAAAKSLQLCPTLCDPIDGSPLGSSVSGILQARILEWGAIAFSNA